MKAGGGVFSWLLESSLRTLCGAKSQVSHFTVFGVARSGLVASEKKFFILTKLKWRFIYELYVLYMKC